jgi:hypothetical protein
MSLQTETNKPSPWAKLPPSTTDLYSLTDVMSEQLACDLHMKEATLGPAVSRETAAGLTKSQDEGECLATEVLAETAAQDSTDNDFLIAQLLQLEIDKEFDEALKRQESVVNRNSRGTDREGHGNREVKSSYKN